MQTFTPQCYVDSMKNTRFDSLTDIFEELSSWLLMMTSPLPTNTQTFQILLLNDLSPSKKLSWNSTKSPVCVLRNTPNKTTLGNSVNTSTGSMCLVTSLRKQLFPKSQSSTRLPSNNFLSLPFGSLRLVGLQSTVCHSCLQRKHHAFWMVSLKPPSVYLRLKEGHLPPLLTVYVGIWHSILTTFYKNLFSTTSNFLSPILSLFTGIFHRFVRSWKPPL